MICPHGLSGECEQSHAHVVHREEFRSYYYRLFDTISYGIVKSHRGPHSLGITPACAGYRLGTYYRAHDEHGSLYSLYSSEEYRHMKWSYVCKCGRHERGGGDDGDGRDDEYMSHHLCLLVQYGLYDRTAIYL